ncbi:MAG: YaiI/YqxD family protein [Pseudomonadota bacterium]
MIYVDADACPVKEETVRVATRHGTPVVMVANGGIRPPREPNVTLAIVPKEPDAADQYIEARIGPGDICITQDILLGAKCLDQGALAVRPDGEEFTPANIGTQLGMKELMADLRAADPLRPGSGKSFGPKDRARFLQTLDRLIRAAKRTAS